VQYDIPSNSNSKMIQKVYLDAILKPVVKPWLDQGAHFILEEDGDSWHGPLGQNIGKKWKQKHGLRHFFNCPGSPDMSPIEKAWKVPGMAIKDV